MSTQVTMRGVHVTRGTDGSPIVSVRPTSQAGNRNAQFLPQNCCLLVDKSTNSGGRRSRGRFFVPAITQEDSVSDVGQISGSLVTELQAAMDVFFDALATPLAGMAAGPIPMFLLHSNGISSVPPPTLVTKLTVQSVISTQRRRLR
jgi:hypothetical protein